MDWKIIKFEDYCYRCKNVDVLAENEPCNSCLTNPARPNNSGPLNFVEGGEKVEKRKSNTISKRSDLPKKPNRARGGGRR